jgi:hypothetical protein
MNSNIESCNIFKVVIRHAVAPARLYLLVYLDGRASILLALRHERKPQGLSIQSLPISGSSPHKGG